MTSGGPRPGAGRKTGSPNKVGADVRELARQYTDQAIETLAQIMLHGKESQARASAADKLLDRGWGRPAQAHTGEGGEGPIRHQVSWQLPGTT